MGFVYSDQAHFALFNTLPNMTTNQVLHYLQMQLIE